MRQNGPMQKPIGGHIYMANVQSQSRILNISEIFSSIQGEGVYAGIPMTFVRLQGCPYRCVWCDSTYTWDVKPDDADYLSWEGPMSIDAVVAQVKALGNKWVCVTGGEPLVQSGVWQLFNYLHVEGLSIECETSGGMLITEPDGINKMNSGRDVHWVVDMKPPLSGMESINKYENLNLVHEGDQVKFVCASEGDVKWALALLHRTRDSRDPKTTILFSPVHESFLADQLTKCVLDAQLDLKRAHVLNYRVSLQLHKVIWADITRGV